MAEPEEDGWEYSVGESYVCSGFATALWKAGGLFEGLEINANEFGPRDVYEIDFFEVGAQLPGACAEADPGLGYCQLMGKYRIELPGYSTVDPYSHMNENCPSQPPEYLR